VRQPIRELGTAAFDLLFAMINRERPASRDMVLPTTLVRRESCGCASGETGRGER
jgi:DNA-binding LacI/PurR family transcriptional regulator